MRNAECGFLHCAWFALLTLPALVGCGDGKTVVSGTVTFDGQSVEVGTISFVPQDTSQASDAGKIVDGRFSVLATPGAKKVVIRASRPAENVAPNDPDAAALREDYIPARYNSQTELTAELPADGDLQFDLRSE